MDELDGIFGGLDQPIPLPDELKARLEQAMLDPLSGLDEPVALPDPLRDRLEVALTRRRAARPLLAAAAVIVLLAGVLSALALARGAGGHGPALAASAPPPTTPAASAVGSSGSGAADQATPGAASSPPSTGPPSRAASPSSGAFIATGEAPPFAFPASTLAGPSGVAASPSAVASPAVKVGVIRGDAAEEAGFAAYLRALDQSGARHIEAVDVSPGHPAAGTVATVNLSGVPVASSNGAASWVSGPLLETLLAPEALLHGSVFDFSSAAERQAHLAADALFPSAAPGSTAVIYRSATGVLGATVPAALQQVLQARGVLVTTVVYRPGQPLPAATASAAFLSLDQTEARAWMQAARSVTFPKGVAGVGDLLDPTLAGLLPANATVISPYALASGAEAAALGPAGAEQLHGWVAAKTLAVALWRSGTISTAALAQLAGYGDDLRPAYGVHPGTTSRTAEGLAYVVRNRAFVAVGSFRSDAF